MQRFRRRVKADISGNDTLHQSLVKALIIRAIGQKATGHHHGHEIRFGMVGHRLVLKV